MADYRFSGLADADFDSIAEYSLVRFGERQMRAYTDDIISSAELVADFPHMGRSFESKSGTRYLRYNCGRHTLVYQERTYGILIVRILHQSMDFDRHLT